MRKISLFFAVTIITVLVWSSSMVVSEGTGDYPPPENGSWIITNETYVANETITLTGNLIITSNAILTLNNVTLKINSSYPLQYGVEVQNNGKMYAYQSNITTNTKYSFSFCKVKIHLQHFI